MSLLFDANRSHRRRSVHGLKLRAQASLLVLQSAVLMASATVGSLTLFGSFCRRGAPRGEPLVRGSVCLRTGHIYAIGSVSASLKWARLALFRVTVSEECTPLAENVFGVNGRHILRGNRSISQFVLCTYIGVEGRRIPRGNRTWAYVEHMVCRVCVGNAGGRRIPRGGVVPT